MNNIESLHIGLDGMYLNIFTMYCGESQKKAFLSKILGFDKKTVGDEEKTLALRVLRKNANIRK